MKNMITPLKSGEEMDLRAIACLYLIENSALSPLTLKIRKSDIKQFIEFYYSYYGTYSYKFWYPRDSMFFIENMRKRGYSVNYLNRITASLKTFGSFFLEKGYLLHNPCRGIREIPMEQPPPKSFESKELSRLYKSAEMLAVTPRSIHAQDVRNKTVILVLEGTGLRIEEVLSLKLSQFINGKFLNVRTKGGSVRSSVPFRKEVTESITDYIVHHRTEGSHFLFTNYRGQKLSRNGIAKAINKIAYFTNAAFGSVSETPLKVHPHKFRHTHARMLYEKTKDPILVARRLNHSSIKYVSRYATSPDVEIEKALENI
jgi:integrase/recombinase XerC